MIKTFATLVLAAALAVFVVLPLGAALYPVPAQADETLLVNLRPGHDGGTAASYYQQSLGGRQLAVDCLTHPVRYLACKVTLAADGGNVDGGAAPACAADGTSARVPADLNEPKVICVNGSNNTLTLYKVNDAGTGNCNVYQSQPKTRDCL